MLKENLKDAAEIIRNILSQPLDIPNASPDINLLRAAKEYHHSLGPSSDLGKILSTFLDYPGPTDMLITELEIILNDLYTK